MPLADIIDRYRTIYGEERSNPMRLKDIVFYLETNLKTEKYPSGIIIATDLGGHANCVIDSNCPEAIKMRKIFTEAELSLPDLQKAWHKLRMEGTPPIKPLGYTYPDFEGKAKISIAGNIMEIDVGEEVKRQLTHHYAQKIDEFRRASSNLQEIGHSLYNNYLHHIYEAKHTRTLPQIAIPLHELLRYKCQVTSIEKEYLFMFPILYAPQWIFTAKDRYEMKKEHAEYLRQEVIISYHISVDRRIVAVVLLNQDGEKFVHYHGTGYDCWGDFVIPEVWDGSLKALATLTYQLQAALTTINRESLMREHPRGMPSIIDLFDAAKKLGEEGKLSKSKKKKVEEPEEEVAASPRRHWGNEGQQGEHPEEGMNPFRGIDLASAQPEEPSTVTDNEVFINLDELVHEEREERRQV